MNIHLRALFCWAVVMVAVVHTRSQSDATHEAITAKYVMSFAGPADLHWALPPAAETTLRIIAGPPDVRPKEYVMQLPVAAVTDSHDRLLVADSGTRKVHMFDRTHRRYSEIDLNKVGMQSVAGIAVDDHDRIYLTDVHEGKVYVLSSRGKFLGHLQERKGNEAYYVAPVGIAVDPARGFVYVCDRDRNMVIKLTRAGHVVREFGARGGGTGAGNFRLPTEIAISNGEMLVLDSGNQRIQRLSLDGKFLGEIHMLSDGTGIAVDRSQRVFVSEPSMRRVSIYGMDGKLNSSITASSSKSGPFDPVGLWVHEHCLYVVDSNNSRVHLFAIGSEAGDACRL